MKARRPCSGPWKYVRVGFDGVVSVCCMDCERKLAIGNVKDTSIDELWDGGQITQYRIWHITGEFDKMPQCLHCNNMDSPKMTDEEILDYLKSIKREDLIPKFKERMKA